MKKILFEPGNLWEDSRIRPLEFSEGKFIISRLYMTVRLSVPEKDCTNPEVDDY